MQRLANILIASANSDGLNDLVETLSDNNCNSLVCEGETEFVEEARRSQPDLAILDIDSLGDDVRALVEHLNGDMTTTGIPIVLFGASKTPALMTLGRELRIDEILTADVSSEEVLLRLRPVLRLSTMRAETRRRVTLARRMGVTITSQDVFAVDDDPFKVLLVGVEDLASLGAPKDLIRRCIVTPCLDHAVARELIFDGSFDAVIVRLARSEVCAECGEFCSQIRHNPRLFNLPLVVLAEDGAFDDRMEPMRHGASRVLPLPSMPEELEFVVLTLTNRQRLRWRMRAIIEQTHAKATADPRSCCYSMPFLSAHLEQLIAAAREWQKHLTLAVFRFPAIVTVGEEFGQEAGDHLMRQMAQWITGLVRVEDVTAHEDGYDFYLALPDTPIAEARMVLHRIAGVLAYTDFAVEEVYRPIQVEVLMGFAELEPDDTAETLAERARANVR